jgi:hypothetical protein
VHRGSSSHLIPRPPVSLAQLPWEDFELETGKPPAGQVFEVPESGVLEVVVRVSKEGVNNDTPVRKGAHVSSLVHLFEDPRSAGRMQDHDKMKVRCRTGLRVVSLHCFVYAPLLTSVSLFLVNLSSC